jgi:hypothetical protein
VTCQVTVHSKAQIKREIEAAGSGYESLSASRKLESGALTFDALSLPVPLRGSPPTQWVEFTASYARRLHGMWFSASTRVGAESAEGFAVSPSTGTPGEATVEPPAPFKGSAEFTLESPSVASWTGNLRVPIPTLGTVALTGPDFKPTLCGSGGCTNTAPGSHVTVSLPGSFSGNFFAE